MRRLIALDIDGTLFNSEKEIMPRTKDALIQAQQEGDILVLASGRPTSGLKGIAKQLDMDQYHGLLLGYNGGAVTDYTTGADIYKEVISDDLTGRLLKHLESFQVTPIIDDGVYIYTNEPDGFQVAYEGAANDLMIKEVLSVREGVTFAPAKVLVAAPEEVMTECKEKIIAPFAGELDFTLSTPFYLEVTPKGVNKAKTLGRVCKKLGIGAEDVIAFGDGENDVTMIEFAGKGVAMANACEALKKAADVITLSNDEDGIAEVLKRL